MSVLYAAFGVLSLAWAAWAMATVGVVAGLPGLSGSLVWFGLAWLLGKNRELEDRIRRLETMERPQTQAVTEPAPDVPVPVGPPVDSEEAAVALRAAQDLHFEKRFVAARTAYRDLIDRFPNTKQAVVARQQLDNLRNS